MKLLLSIYNFCFSLSGLARGVFWNFFLKKRGQYLCVSSGVRIASPNNVEMGSNVFINRNSSIHGGGGVIIGDGVLIASNVQILSIDHNYSNWEYPIVCQKVIKEQVIIEDACWIGVNAVILPGIKIGKGAIIGANAVVTKDVEPFSIVGGVPAKFIKFRFSQEVIDVAIKKDYKYKSSILFMNKK